MAAGGQNRRLVDHILLVHQETEREVSGSGMRLSHRGKPTPVTLPVLQALTFPNSTADWDHAGAYGGEIFKFINLFTPPYLASCSYRLETIS